MNQIKTAALLGFLAALFLLIGYLVGGQTGVVIALAFAVITNFSAYWWSDKIVLRMYNAQPLTEAQAPELFRIVRALAQRDGLPMPAVYIIPEESPNAFATGRDPQHAAVAVTEGIMRLLDSEELSGVLGHELSHVKHRDTLITTVTATIAGALSMLTNMAMWGLLLSGRSSDDDDRSSWLGLIGIIVAPIAAAIIQMAISRSREYSADESGAALSGNPLALASALSKVEAWSQKVPMKEGSPATAHLFIINPFKAGGIAQLFSSHPPTEERIHRLQALANRSYHTPRH
ncbi:MAG TPA: zinc metalloprotease HtpX [Blastocatellia bacterium]|nr:zinc metalloprotease HtpX [Blastocatellia bacterium]